MAPFKLLPEREVRAIRTALPGAEVIEASGEDPVSLGRELIALGGCDVLLSTLLPGDPRAYRGLRWIQLTSAGADVAVRSPAWGRPGITVTTSSGMHAAAISQWVFGLILFEAQRLQNVLEFKRNRTWTQPHHWPHDWRLLAGVPLAGRTLGILGMGSVGYECARLGRALGMNVVAVRNDGTSRAPRGLRYVGEDIARRSAFDDRIHHVPFSSMDRVLRRCDYLLLALPLTASTKGLIGAAQLRQMKRRAVLINVGRGGVVDEAALIEALQAGRPGAAMLDVFEDEPLSPDSPLFDLANAILSPHVAGLFTGYWRSAAKVFRANLSRYLDGRELLNLVDRGRGY